MFHELKLKIKPDKTEIMCAKLKINNVKPDNLILGNTKTDSVPFIISMGVNIDTNFNLTRHKTLTGTLAMSNSKKNCTAFNSF